MRQIRCCLLYIFVFASLSFSAPSQAQVFEMRTYTTNEGKLDELHTRFRDHTMKLFDKHGIKNVGYWVPTEEEKSKNTLIYIIEHKNQAAAKKSWDAFMADPEWKAAYKASIANGNLVKNVESVFMVPTSYSPIYKTQPEPKNAVFELRIYNTNKGKLEGLNARFRDHTLKLFDKHGITNVAYWTPVDSPKSEDQLIYIIRHQSSVAARKSWQAFGSDEAWKKVARESQKDGKFLRERPTSIYMTATKYSPMK